MLQRPNVVGLKSCQQVIVEEHTHNVTLVNCFRNMSFAQFPAQADEFLVSFVLTDGKGRGTLTVRITSLVDLEAIWSRSWDATFL
jgi:hypothetical protein